MNRHANVVMLEQVASHLGTLLDEVVFVGGAVTSLLITDPAATEVRFTQDVDMIVQVTSHADYYQLEKRLRLLGFVPDQSQDAPLCRWLIDGIQVDVMPTDESILGFSNRWYPLAIKTAQVYSLNTQLKIRLITPPCFVATKVEAFLKRGSGDYWASSDLEDIIMLVDGRSEIVAEIQATDPKLKEYLTKQIHHWLQDKAFKEALAEYFAFEETNQQRVPIIKQRLMQCLEN